MRPVRRGDMTIQSDNAVPYGPQHVYTQRFSVTDC